MKKLTILTLGLTIVSYFSGTNGITYTSTNKTPLETIPCVNSPYPFSFVYAGKASRDLLKSWQRQETAEYLDENRKKTVTTWTDPQSGLRVLCEAIRFKDFPAEERLVYFETPAQQIRRSSNRYRLWISVWPTPSAPRCLIASLKPRVPLQTKMILP